MNDAQYSKACYVGLQNALRDGTIATPAERFEVEDAIRDARSFEELPQRVQSILKPAFDAMEEYLQEASMATKSIGMLDGIESKALPFRRRLRMEPYDPDAEDGDGDGIVQDGTPWERPVGTRVLNAMGNDFPKGATMNRRVSGMRIVDQDGNDVNYRPRVSRIPDVGLRRLARSVSRPNKTQSQPVISPKEKINSPLGQLGHPTLRERGHANLDEYVTPPPVPEGMPDPSAPKSVAENVERIREKSPKAFPDLPDPDKWPPTLTVTPQDVADARALWDESFAVENELLSQINEAAYELVDSLKELFKDAKPDALTEEEWEEFLDDAITKEFTERLVWAALGYTTDELRDYEGQEAGKITQDIAEQVEVRAARFVELARSEGVPIYHISVEGLLQAIADGRFKTQFETGASRGHFNPITRAEWENGYLDLPLDLPDSERPVYAALDVPVPNPGADIPGKPLDHYGRVRIILSDDVKDRATLTIGDSLHTDSQPYPVSGVEPPFSPSELYSRRSREAERDYVLLQFLQGEIDNSGRTLELMLRQIGLDIEDVLDEDGAIVEWVRAALMPGESQYGMAPYRRVGTYPWFKSYVEMQIFGGMSIYDIQEIQFPRSAEQEFEQNPEFRAMIKILEELNIPYSFVR